MKTKEIIEFYRERNMPEGIIEKAINIDETPTKKYVNYLLKQYTRGHSLYDTNVLVKYFEKLLPYIDNKDIYSKEYDYFYDLESVINIAKLKKEIKRINKLSSTNVFIIEETDDYILLHPKNFDTAKRYGYGTKWCVTSSPNYYDDYKNTLAYLIFKKDVGNENYEKLAFHSNSRSDYFSIYDATDDKISADFLTYKLSHCDVEIASAFSSYQKFAKRNKYKWIKRFLPWTMCFKVNH